jgi:hypothetical protein
MKLFKIGLLFALVVAFSLPAVCQTQLVLDVPFNFIVAGKTLPAGHYLVSRPVRDISQTVWLISNGLNAAFIHTNGVQSPFTEHRPSMIFWHSGGEYTLARFWTNAHQGQDLLLKPRVKSTFWRKTASTLS